VQVRRKNQQHTQRFRHNGVNTGAVLGVAGVDDEVELSSIVADKLNPFVLISEIGFVISFCGQVADVAFPLYFLQKHKRKMRQACGGLII
jgi:hypothetical protein